MMNSTLPPRAGTSPSRAPGGMSRLAVMQAKFQAKQLAEKEEKMINLLETREEETSPRVNYGRNSANSNNSLSSTNSNNSANVSVGARPTMPQHNLGRARHVFEERRAQEDQEDRRENNGNGPVQAINKEVRTPMYKQSVSRVNSNNKYGGNYGPKADGNSNIRGKSLDRIRSSGYSNMPTGLPRARSHANIPRTTSSEDSSLSSRPPSGFGYNYQRNSKSTQKLPINPPVSRNSRYSNNQLSPDDELSPQNSSVRSRRNSYQAPSRDYVRPSPPSHNRGGTSVNRENNIGLSRILYRDNSPYSSHGSDQSSDPPVYNVVPGRASNRGSRESPLPHTTPLSSAKKNYNQRISRENSLLRQNTFNRENEEQNNRINNRTFRKQKSPRRRTERRSSTVSPDRSPENSDETDLANNSDYEMRVATRAEAGEREEERRRMQIEMRKREQELLAKIIQQQKELETVKTQKSRVEKELEKQEKQWEKERRALEEKEKQLLEEQERRIQDEKDNLNREKNERRLQEEKLRRNSSTIQRHLPSSDRGPYHKAPLSSRVVRESSTGRADIEVDEMKTSYITSNLNNQVNIEIKSAEKNPPAAPQNFRRNTNSPMIRKNNRHTSNEKPATKKEVVRRSIFAPKERDDLEPCKNCGRNFASDRIEKHTEICIKTSKKKRKTFDTVKARVSGTDAQAYVKNKAHFEAKEAQKGNPEGKRQDWREKRAEFINALREAKESQRQNAND